jgi:steroid 5-alpha reductase family enzyme
MSSDHTTTSSRDERSGGAASLVTIVVAVLIGAGMAVAGSSGGLRLGGWPVFALCAVLAFGINWVAFVPAYLGRTERFYDLTGTLSYLSVMALALLAGSGSTLSILLAVLVAVWAVRLGTFLVLRIRKDGSDGRFDAIKVDPLRFLMSWTLQGLWVLLTAGAALAAMTTEADAELGPLTAAGLVVWTVGFAIEATADAQKRAFRRDPANRGRFIRSGLWAWSRHPNYFGEITLWVGIALIALPALSGWQLLTLVSPLFVTVLLTRISGVPLLEARGRKAWGDEPEYREYVARTPVLVPRPPRGR